MDIEGKQDAVDGQNAALQRNHEISEIRAKSGTGTGLHP
jgi:hypothetical protein